MPELINPLAGYRDAYNLLEGQAQDGARRRAGNALAQGDYQGAQGALYGRGMLEDGMAVQQRQTAMQDRETGQQAAMADAEKKAAGERAQRGIAILTRMKTLPPEMIDSEYQSMLRPYLAETLDPEMLARVDAAPKTPENVDLLLTAMGAEAEKLQVIQRGNGGYDVVNMGSGGVQRSVEPTPDAPNVPTGYRPTADGTGLEYIPGGPADPRTVGTRAAAGRAPPRPRSGGGGGGQPASGGRASGLSTQELLAIAGGG